MNWQVTLNILGTFASLGVLGCLIAAIASTFESRASAWPALIAAIPLAVAAAFLFGGAAA